MAQFIEIGRVKVNPQRDIVASKVIDKGEFKGINFNNYVRTQKYTGFTPGGMFVPEGKIEEYSELVRTVLSN
jgi:hypothetical protein